MMTRVGEIVPVVPAPEGRVGRPPRDPAEWTAVFLEHYAEWGNLYEASRVAGVDAKTARKHRRSDRTFDLAVREARRAFIASLQMELVKQGRGVSRGMAIPILARLKATGRRMAERYSEKAVDQRVMNVTINEAPVSLAEADAKLQRMIANASPATLALMAGQPAQAPAEVLEAEIVPEAPAQP